MKKILVYITTVHPAIKRIYLDLAEGFRKHGYDTLIVNDEDFDALGYAQKHMQKGEIYFSIGLNCLGIRMVCNASGKYLYEDLDVLHISILTDAPYHPAVVGMGAPCKKHAICFIDRSHMPALEMRYPSKKFAEKIFMPLGGTSNAPAKEVFHWKRDKDVVFSAELRPLCARKWRRDLNDRHIVALLDETADYLEITPVTVIEGFRFTLTSHGMYGEDYVRRMAPYFWYMLYHIKYWRRVKCLEFLVKNDIDVEVYGDGWEQVPFANRLHLKGTIPYEGLLELYTRTKIMYQDAAEFNDGATERPFNAMLNGAVVVSEYSSYLAEEFENGKDLILYDWKNGEKQVRVICDLLADEPRRLEMAKNAYAKADRKHRWVNRAERILELAALHDLKK